MGLGKVPVLFIQDESILLYRQSSIRTLDEKNHCNKQYSARLGRWLDRHAHFDIAEQNIAQKNMNLTYYLSRNAVGEATPEDKYDEQCVINIMSEQAKLNLKYG